MRLLAVEVPVLESRRLDRPSRRASQLRGLLEPSGFTQRLLAVEIPGPESKKLDRPSRGGMTPVPESSKRYRPSYRPLAPVPESRIVDRASCGAFIPVPDSGRAVRPSRRASKLRDLLELSESTQQAIPIPPVSGGPSMAETNLSAYSRPQSNSVSVIRRSIARLWGISPFRRPRPLDHDPLLRRLWSSRRSLGGLLRLTRSKKTAQAASGTNVGHVAAKFVGTQTYPIDDIPRRETALASENVRNSHSDRPTQPLMRQAVRRAQEAPARDNAGKLDIPQTQKEPRPQHVLTSTLRERGLPPLSEPLCGYPHRRGQPTT